VLLGVIFIVVGFVAFFTPGDTFVGLAAVISFCFVFAGSWNLVTALWTRSVNDGWWVQALSGLIELGLAFWAAGYWDRSATLLVAFVGAMACCAGSTRSCSRSGCTSWTAASRRSARRSPQARPQ
jgi:uncharacterized membrane protein HdeD (DUF308 family)